MRNISKRDCCDWLKSVELTNLLTSGSESAQFILSLSEPDSITWARTPAPNPDSHWTRRLLRRETPADTVGTNTVQFFTSLS